MKYINLFDTQAAYDAAEKYYPNVSYIEATDEVVYQENDPDYYSKEYLTFEALENTSLELVVPAAVDSTYMTSISYSVDDGDNWVTTTIDNTAQTITTPTINAGDKVIWKGVGKQMAYNNNNYYASKFSSTGNYNVEGNIMSLLYGDNFANQTSFPSESKMNFFGLFYNNTKLKSIDNLILPATTLTNNCYQSMFYGCTSLTTAPELPATTLAGSCYSQMFQGCTSLTTAPVLPATTLVQSCYSGMFDRCTSLTTVPSNLLPATTLAQSCYQSMFYGCTSLITAPELPVTTLANSCYGYMFNGCTQLNNIKMLATDITAIDCLQSWVQGVAASGTFTKAASMTTLPEGDSGIPSGWTVVDA